MAKVEPKAKRVMGREEFPYEWDVIENEWITELDCDTDGWSRYESRT